MNIDLFLTTYEPDAGWLAENLRRIRKYATGFRDVVVVSPPGVASIQTSCQEFGAVLHEIPERFPSPMCAQTWKMRADEFCRPELGWACLIDCDCLFMRPTDASALFMNSRPLFCVKNWEGNPSAIWKEGSVAYLGRSIPFDFMSRQGMCFAPRHLQGLRAHLNQLHDGDWEGAYLRCWTPGVDWYRERCGKIYQPIGRPTASEFEVIGGFVWHEFAENFRWWNLDDVGAEPTEFVKWHWSISEEIPKET